MTWRPLSLQAGGKSTHVKFEADGTVLIRTEQDTQGILDANHALRGLNDRGYTPSGDMRRVASIPLAIVMQWAQEGIDVFSGEHQDRVARKLNDPDYAYLRTAPGHLGPVGDGTFR